MSAFLMYVLSLCPNVGLTSAACIEQYMECKQRILADKHLEGSEIEDICAKAVGDLVKRRFSAGCAK